MTGKERIQKAFRCERVDRIPWVPFVGCHAGALLGVTAQEYLKSEKMIIEGVSKAVELYQPDGIPVAFDLQIEAEALGGRARSPGSIHLIRASSSCSESIGLATCPFMPAARASS